MRLAKKVTKQVELLKIGNQRRSAYQVFREIHWILRSRFTGSRGSRCSPDAPENPREETMTTGRLPDPNPWIVKGSIPSICTRAQQHWSLEVFPDFKDRRRRSAQIPLVAVAGFRLNQR